MGNFSKGIFKENPIFIILLGLCPTLAVSTQVVNAIGMGAGVIFVLLGSNIFVSLLKDFIPDLQGDEAGLAFTRDGIACCLLRGNSRTIAMLGIGKPPYYREWEWKHPRVDWHGDGNARPIESNVLRPITIQWLQVMRLKRTRSAESRQGRSPARPMTPPRAAATRIEIFIRRPARRYADGTNTPSARSR